jgi:hypothetical protein
MIDWISLLGNALWILGCALALSILSYASWQASLQGIKLSVLLGHPGIVRYLLIAGLLFCLGLTLTSNALIEQILWVILASLFLISIIFLWKESEEG